MNNADKGTGDIAERIVDAATSAMGEVDPVAKRAAMTQLVSDVRNEIVRMVEEQGQRLLVTPICEALQKISVESAASAAANQIGDSQGHLQATYAQVVAYDNHYSTVRTGTATFLIGVALSLGAFFLGPLKGGAPSAASNLTFAIALPGIILYFAMLLSLHFQRLTHCCRKIEIAIENAMPSASAAAVALNARFRENLKNEIRESKYFMDHANTLLFLGIAAYPLALCLVINFSASHSLLRSINSFTGAVLLYLASGTAILFISQVKERKSSHVNRGTKSWLFYLFGLLVGFVALIVFCNSGTLRHLIHYVSG